MLSKRGPWRRMVLSVLGGMTPLVLEGCKITDQMSPCEKAGLGTLYVLGILALAAIFAGLTLAMALRA